MQIYYFSIPHQGFPVDSRDNTEGATRPDAGQTQVCNIYQEINPRGNFLSYSAFWAFQCI